MQLDLHLRSQNLLEQLANSIHDRNPDDKQFCFNIAELHIVEQWIKDIMFEMGLKNERP